LRHRNNSAQKNSARHIVSPPGRRSRRKQAADLL
jgi:hypothetical protein